MDLSHYEDTRAPEGPVITHASFWEFKEPDRGKRNAISLRRRKRSSCDVARCPVYGPVVFLHFSVWRQSHDLTSSLSLLYLPFNSPSSDFLHLCSLFLKTHALQLFFLHNIRLTELKDRERERTKCTLFHMQYKI